MAPRRGTVGAGEVEAIAKCCVPTECLRETRLVSDPREAIRVLCNNEQCNAGQLMHRECFDQWEATVLAYLRTCGRARSWSERQRLQNLWTKKGYDLAYKACSCSCGRGHIRKDPDWVFPIQEDPHDAKKKKRKTKTPSRLPTLQQDPRMRTSSQSSCSSQSPPGSAPNLSPLHSSVIKKKMKIDFFPDNGSSIRTISNGSGIFCRRQDFSSFNCLPRHKLNSYHIKMEDEGHHGNDETRSFVLSTLAGQQASKVVCILCRAPMQVYDRYPLVDGTFFLSPRQHTTSCFEVKLDGKTQYLSAVCMGCLEAWAPGRRLRCRFCSTPWDGSSLVLGTMYSYDIFAAMPCCTERLKCNSCSKPLLLPHQRLNFFSDYSHNVACPHCGAQDNHFVKPLAFCYASEQP